jgi:hypothetical protein
VVSGRGQVRDPRPGGKGETEGKLASCFHFYNQVS